MNIHYLLHRPHEWWYYFKCLVWKKYNRVKIKTLPPTWNDRDNLLIHGMFQILADFIEKEEPDESIDWDSTPEHRFARNKMDELLDWWRNIYLKFDPYKDRDETKTLPEEEGFTEVDHNGCKVYLMNTNEYETEFCRKVSRLEKEIDDELTKRLIELIGIRNHLWT